MIKSQLVSFRLLPALLNAILLITLGLTSFTGCSKGKLNSQEIKRQQEISEAEALKAEYSQVVGEYHGDLVNPKNDTAIPVILTLILQDVPVDSGTSDPVLTPKLQGSLRVILGSVEMGEFLDAAITSSEYLKITKILNLSTQHEQTGTMTLNLSFDGQSLTGNWTAPTSGSSGTTTLSKK